MHSFKMHYLDKILFLYSDLELANILRVLLPRDTDRDYNFHVKSSHKPHM